MDIHHHTPAKFNITPENGFLEDDPFLLGFGNFSGENLAVKLRGCTELAASCQMSNVIFVDLPGITFGTKGIINGIG